MTVIKQHSVEPIQLLSLRQDIALRTPPQRQNPYSQLVDLPIPAAMLQWRLCCLAQTGVILGS